MGTQQILMIILSVIVVGTAIAVGIQMFDTQLDNSTRQALAAELMQQGAQAQAYFRTPRMMGGGGNGYAAPVNNQPPAAADLNVLACAQYINRSAEVGGGGAQYRNLHGQFTLTSNGVTGNETVTIVGVSDVNTTITATATVPLKGSSGSITVVQN